MDLPHVRVDADMIRRVLINLLENAVKYSPPDGEISLGAEINANQAKIWIQDSGPGMPAKEKTSPFTYFVGGEVVLYFG